MLYLVIILLIDICLVLNYFLNWIYFLISSLNILFHFILMSDLVLIFFNCYLFYFDKFFRLIFFLISFFNITLIEKWAFWLNLSLEFHGLRIWKFTVQEICLGLVVFFFMLIFFQLNPLMFIYFLNFICNSFITFKFGSKLNPTQPKVN